MLELTLSLADTMDTSKLFRVDGMVAVITGGGSGIGLMMALALAGAGAKKVYILGRREDVLKSAAAQHPSLRPLVCDVGSKESLQSAVDTVTKEIGYVNLVIANSGVSGPLSFYNSELSIQELRKSMYEDVSMVEFTDTFRVNATGAYFTLLAFLELLDAGNQNAARGGFGAPLEENSDVLSIQSQVIFTSSAAGVSRLDPLAPAYMASKAAIDHLAKGASTNLSQHGIRVNVLAPGCTSRDSSFPSPISFS